MLESFKLAFNEAFPQWLYDIIMSETFDSVLCLSALIYVFGGIIIFGELYEYITKRMAVVAISVWARACRSSISFFRVLILEFLFDLARS